MEMIFMVNFSKTPWSQFPDSAYSNDQYKRSALWCDQQALKKGTTPKEACKLPVKEPAGQYNINGIEAAWGVLQGAHGNPPNIPSSDIPQIKSKIKSLYTQAGLNIPDEMKAADSTINNDGDNTNNEDTDFAPSDYTDQEWQHACLFEVHSGHLTSDCTTPKQCYQLPVMTPDGKYDPDLIEDAWNQVKNGNISGATANDLTALKFKLASLYNNNGLEMPDEMKTIQNTPGTSQTPKITAGKSEPGAKGKIWGTGIHNVFVNGKPAKVFTPQYTIEPTYNTMQKEIKDSGGITLGIDHIPDELLAKYPILNKLNLHDVGKATEIATDGEGIYTINSEHTNPLIAELHSKGELPAFSIVANFTASPCETGQADYVLDEIKEIERVDYVNEGGCIDCKVGKVPDNMIITAKLSTEVNNMTEENNQTEENSTEGTQETEATNGENQTEENEESTESTEENNEESTEEESREETSPEFDPVKFRKDLLEDVKGLISTGDNQVSEKVEAKFAEINKKTAEVEFDSEFERQILAGKATPAMKKGLKPLVIKEDGSFDKTNFDTLMAAMPDDVWNKDEISAYVEAKNSGNEIGGKGGNEGKPSYADYKKARKANKI
jgi:hypothetical protein